MNANLKSLAKQAKERLKTAGEISSGNSQALAANTSYTFVANMRAIEDDPLFPKVKRLLEKSEDEIIINPISQLVSKKYLETLSAESKEKYILKLIKKYNTIKDYIISNNLINQN